MSSVNSVHLPSTVVSPQGEWAAGGPHSPVPLLVSRGSSSGLSGRKMKIITSFLAPVVLSWLWYRITLSLPDLRQKKNHNNITQHSPLWMFSSCLKHAAKQAHLYSIFYSKVALVHLLTEMPEKHHLVISLPCTFC